MAPGSTSAASTKIKKGPCTHMTMIRLYGRAAICSRCRRRGAFGWVYFCIDDSKDLYVDPQDRGPSAREKLLGFFDETPPEQLASYRPDQILTILRQRDDVHAKVEQSKDRYSDGSIPFCGFKVCPGCQPKNVHRAFASLDAVADDPAPLISSMQITSLVPWELPVAKAKVLQKARARDPSHRQTGTLEQITKVAVPEHQLHEGESQSIQEKSDSLDQETQTPVAPVSVNSDHTEESLNLTPRYDNLASMASTVVRALSHGSTIPSPWTPPSSPRVGTKQDQRDTRMAGTAKEENISQDQWRGVLASCIQNGSRQ